MADLARIEIKEEELDKLRGEIDSILEYVGQVKSVAGSHFAPAPDDAKAMPDQSRDEAEIGLLRNVMRKDANPTLSGTYTKELLAEMPATKENYLKVKKIL